MVALCTWLCCVLVLSENDTRGMAPDGCGYEDSLVFAFIYSALADSLGPGCPGLDHPFVFT